jgi:hypothetical protein
MATPTLAKLRISRQIQRRLSVHYNWNITVTKQQILTQFIIKRNIYKQAKIHSNIDYILIIYS